MTKYSANEDIRILLLKECVTINKLSKLTKEKGEKEMKADGLSKKLRANTLRYTEAKMIADLLGYDLIFKRRQ